MHLNNKQQSFYRQWFALSAWPPNITFVYKIWTYLNGQHTAISQKIAYFWCVVTKHCIGHIFIINTQPFYRLLYALIV